MVLTIIISDQLVISNSTKVSSAVLSVQYDKLLADLKGEGGPVELNGEEIYQIRCASCHKFDIKLVGPPHNEVVPKYFGKEKELIAYIKNPTKIDPNYPPMPNPGLKPNEVKAVVDYVLEQVKQNIEK
jgi:cytochrome c